MTLSPDTAIASAQRTLTIEAQAILALCDRLDNSFSLAVACLLNCTGRVVISGIGKSGHIAKKIASTLASTGTPAFFVHPAEALHGDLGMITANDVLIAISYSGSSAELMTIMPIVKRMGAKLISMTGNPQSDLAQLADIHLDVHVSTEACPHNLAPTASSTTALALGDALAVSCLQARGFGPDDFARSHPGGALGKRLLTTVRDVMRTGNALPKVYDHTRISDALIEISSKGMGMTAVLNADQRLIGIFTDGDLRRMIEREGDVRQLTVAQGMSPNPSTIKPDALAAEAAAVMDLHRKNGLLVCDQHGNLMGALHLHDLMAAKVV